MNASPTPSASATTAGLPYETCSTDSVPAVSERGPGTWEAPLPPEILNHWPVSDVQRALASAFATREILFLGDSTSREMSYALLRWLTCYGNAGNALQSGFEDFNASFWCDYYSRPFNVKYLHEHTTILPLHDTFIVVHFCWATYMDLIGVISSRVLDGQLPDCQEKGISQNCTPPDHPRCHNPKVPDIIIASAAFWHLRFLRLPRRPDELDFAALARQLAEELTKTTERAMATRKRFLWRTANPSLATHSEFVVVAGVDIPLFNGTILFNRSSIERFNALTVQELSAKEVPVFQLAPLFNPFQNELLQDNFHPTFVTHVSILQALLCHMFQSWDRVWPW